MYSIGIIEKKESKKLYQWDLERQIKITAPKGIEVDEAHFAHPHDKEALVVRTKNADGELVADIPNILLQSSMSIKVWLVSEDQTVYSDILVVIQRAKPVDYNYTETEVLRYEDLEKRIKALEENGGGGSSGETWTTLLDVTLEEDVNTIEVTTDMDGNPFKAKKMRLTFIGTMTDARLNLHFDSGTEKRMQNTYFYQIFKANTYLRAMIEIGEQLINGMCKSESYTTNDKMDAMYTLNAQHYNSLSTRYTSFLDRIRMNMQTDKFFTAGTRIMVEGVLES